MSDYNKKASREILKQVAEKLTANGMHATVVATGEEAKTKVLEMLEKTVAKTDEIMTMTSITLQTIGLLDAIKDGGYTLVRNIFADPQTTPKHKRELGAAPDISLASVAAVTENGEIVVASATGSQLPALAYGAGKAILVVGSQKIVPNVEAGIARIYNYVLPLESERANKAYNSTKGSSVNKVLIVNKEGQPGRIEVVLVEEALGF